MYLENTYSFSSRTCSEWYYYIIVYSWALFRSPVFTGRAPPSRDLSGFYLHELQPVVLGRYKIFFLFNPKLKKWNSVLILTSVSCELQPNLSREVDKGKNGLRRVEVKSNRYLKCFFPMIWQWGIHFKHYVCISMLNKVKDSRRRVNVNSI
jgi:hypothetical protein